MLYDDGALQCFESLIGKSAPVRDFTLALRKMHDDGLNSGNRFSTNMKKVGLSPNAMKNHDIADEWIEKQQEYESQGLDSTGKKP